MSLLHAVNNELTQCNTVLLDKTVVPDLLKIFLAILYDVNLHYRRFTLLIYISINTTM